MTAKQVTQANDHLAFLDVIRGVAILGVFLFHSLGVAFGFDKLPWSGMFPKFEGAGSFVALYPFTYGGAGVAVFFVVSGFCIHLSHRRSMQDDWRLFFHRRFFRIYPPYIFAILVFCFVWPWGSFPLDNLYNFIQLATHILAIHNFDERSFLAINPSFWSISVEIQLYIIYPLLLSIQRKLGWRKCLYVVGIFEVAIRTASSLQGFLSFEILPKWIAFSPFAYWLSWSFGAYLAECFLTHTTSRIFAARIEVVAAISIMVPLFKPTAAFGFLSTAWLTAIIIDRLISGHLKIPDKAGTVTAALWAHLASLGTLSYSFYLFHQPIIGLMDRVLRQTAPGVAFHPLVKYAMCMMWYPLVFGLSLLAFRCIEQPSIALGKVMWLKMPWLNSRSTSPNS